MQYGQITNYTDDFEQSFDGKIVFGDKVKLLEIKEKWVDREEVERRRLFNVYLFGLPRSGTSMTTRILELLGINMIHTSEDYKDKTDEKFKKKFGEYHANPTGFYEITRDQFKMFLKVLSTPYSGCKMVVPVQGYRWEVVTGFPSKVILMHRDPEEIRQSQMAYYRKDNISIAAIRTQLVQEKMKLKRHKIDHMVVEYRDILDDPKREILKIAKFIRMYGDIQPAIDFVNPDQNRFKVEELEVGL
jgi:hypothetical protein